MELEKPIRSISTVAREYNAKLRLMQDKYNEYARLREECAQLKVEFDLAQRAKFQKEKEEAIDKAIASMKPEELAEAVRLAKRKGLA